MTTRRAAVIAAIALTATFFGAPPAAASGAVANPGFEADGGAASATGWSETGADGASYTEAGGHSGGFRLTHWSASAYRVETYQKVTGLARGHYVLRVWVRSSGGQASAAIGLRGCGGPAGSTAIGGTSTTDWSQVSVSADVRDGHCTISLASTAHAGEWINFDDVTLTRADGSRPSIRGGDVSTLKKNEDFGGVYYTSSGQPADALSILRSAGMDYARLKVWVDPADGYNTKAKVLQMAKRIKAQHMKLLIDFHYSDTWADPGHQTKPAAWAAYSVEELTAAVHDFTYDLLDALRRQGTTADMVQIGNEINGGMLWPDGDWAHWPNLAAFLTAGAQAAKAVSPSTRVMLHLGNGGDNGLYRWFFDNATAFGVPFDVIGASYYCYWHGSLESLQANLTDMVQRYGKDVVVAETAYGFTTAESDHEANIFTPALQQTCGNPATPQGQAEQLRSVIDTVRAVPGGHGLGVFYWEPTWTAVAGAGWDPADPASGDGWENQALFDYGSRPLPAMKVLGRD